MYRQKSNPPFTPLDVLFEALATLAIITMIAQLIMNYSSLPEIVPTHYGTNGSPDVWGNKTSMLLLPIVAVVLYIGLTVINFYPYLFNYPIQLTE